MPVYWLNDKLVLVVKYHVDSNNQLIWTKNQFIWENIFSPLKMIKLGPYPNYILTVILTSI